MKLFTVTKFRYPKHVEDTFTDYTFYYEHAHTYQTFFTNHCISDIDLSYNEFQSIRNDIVKKICFVFFVLYVHGGFFIDLNVIPGKDLKTFTLKSNTFYCVESMLNNGTLFSGIFGSEKGNSLLLQLIKDIIALSNISSDITSNQLYALIKQKTGVQFLSEKILYPHCASTLSPDNRMLFDHYYDPKVSYTIPFQNTPIKLPNNVKIGITLLLLNDVKSFFSNGINQNSLFLCELLLNCGFDVYFIVEDTKLLAISDETMRDILYDPRFQLKKYSEILHAEFHVIITLSFSYGEQFIYNYLKHMNTKHVGYFCGNSYIIETEKILYNQHKERQKDAYDFTINGLTKYDEIWSIPQMSEINLDFWSILFKCKCIEVPFVWSNNAITLFCKANKCKEEDLLYKNRGPDKKVAIFEPNISIMKWALPSILMCESAYRNNKHLKHLYVTNINSSSTNDFNLTQFNKLMNTLDIVKDKKCSIESRYTTLPFMSNHADIAVSHQWGNPLNYLYFDLAWMGWPIIHNAHLCKDVGYFYRDFHLNDGADILEKVIETHDLHKDKYLDDNRKAIARFLPTNVDIQEIYKNYIFQLF
ncbi:MAG: DUF2827 family protein [Flavobacterium sp.]